MKSIFELVGTKIANQYFLRAIFESGCGVVEVHRFGMLEIGALESERVVVGIVNSKEWCGLQEPEDWDDVDRKVHPYARNSRYAYLEYSLDRFIIIPTSNHSRFLSLIAPFPGSCTLAVDKRDDVCAFVLSDIAELGACLGDVLIKLGVPNDNIEQIKMSAISVLL